MAHIDLSPAVRWGVSFLALLGVVVALWLGRPLFLPVVISLLLATLLWPAVNYFNHRWRLSRPIAGLLAIAGLVAVSCLGIIWVTLAIQQLVQDLPHTYQDQQENYDLIRRRVENVSPVVAEQMFPQHFEDSLFFKKFNTLVEEQTQEAPGYLLDALKQILLILFVVLFLCIEGEMLMRRTAEIFGPATEPGSRAALKALHEMARQVRAYLIWRTLINLGMTIFLGIVYTQLDLKQAWTWATLSGVLTFIPYLGPVVAGVPAIIDAFVGHGLPTALIVFVIYGAVLVLEGYVLFPLVLGRHMEMNATTVMIACLFWWVVWGEIGLFLALPLVAVIKAICNNVPDWHPWANLMSNEPSTTQTPLVDPVQADAGRNSSADAGVDRGNSES